MRIFMPEDTVFSATLRHPFAQLQSAFHHYDLPYHLELPPSNDSFSLFLSNPEKYDKPLNASLYNPIARQNGLMTSFTKSRMAFEFGFDVERGYIDPAYVREYTEYLGNTFKHVIITEYYDESLLMLRRKLCWDYSDIIYLPLRRQNYSEKQTTPSDYGVLYENHRKWAKLDYGLYEFFLERHQQEKRQLGSALTVELAYFRSLLSNITDFCHAVCKLVHSSLLQRLIRENKYQDAYSYLKTHKLTVDASSYHAEFILYADECIMMFLDERYVTKAIRKYQYQSYRRTVFKLDHLLYTERFLYKCT